MDATLEDLGRVCILRGRLFTLCFWFRFGSSRMGCLRLVDLGDVNFLIVSVFTLALLDQAY